VGPLSATIAKGEIVGLLGLNGAGKTTTLRILACDLLPTSGTVKVGGYDVVAQPDEVRAKTGYLPDSPPLYVDMTVDEYLTYVARLRGVARADIAPRIDEAVELTEVADERDSIIGTLSHGYRQRVGIAQAIVHRPDFVVLDEPISGLDPVQIVEMRGLVRNLGGDHTVVISSHNLTEISETCDRILVIRDGQIVASGTEAELSAQLGQGVRVDITLRLPAAGSAAEDVLRSVEGVRAVEAVDATEPGDRVATYHVSAERDVREALCRAAVGANFGILSLSRGERELESVFLELSRPAAGARRAKKKRKPREPVEPRDEAAT
jgi:ABC-2 type transport system ATP-binding protein